MICRACNRQAHDACPGEIHSGMPCACVDGVCGGTVMPLISRAEQALLLRREGDVLLAQASKLYREATAIETYDAYDERKMQ